ncbi:hypothetical protein P3W45_000187 [Vairimorpha bombi]
MIDFKCTEYFINNEISSSFLMIPNIEYFFIQVVSVLNREYLKKFVTLNVLKYSNKIPLIYSERLVVHNLEIETSYIKYLTDNFYIDKYFRYAVVHIFDIENVFSKLEKLRFKNKMIDYLNRTNDEQDFINIFEMYMMLILKEKKNKKIQYLDYIPEEHTCKLEIPRNNKHECIKFENINKINLHKEEEMKNLDLENKTVNLYTNLLKRNLVKNLDRRIIEEFIKIMENRDEHIKFLKYLMKTHPQIVGEFMGCDDEVFGEWCVQDIYKIICSKRNKFKDIIYKPIKIHKYTGNLFQKLLDLNIQDDEIFLFGYISNREVFFKKFGSIDNLMSENEYFYGTLMNCILRKF